MTLPETELRLRDLEMLLDVSREVGATIELDVLIRRIETAGLNVLNCERVSVFLYDADHDELWSTFSTGVDEIRFPADTGIAGEAFQTGSLINVTDAYADARFNPDIDRSTGYRTRNILTVPMFGYEGEPVGVLQVLNKQNGSFSSNDEELALTLSSLVGVAVQRQLLLQAYTEKQQMEHDLAVAREIQQSLLPKIVPHLNGLDIAGWNRPASETGGDTYDFIPITSERLGVVLADASGHGIGAALMVAECRALVRALVSASVPLQDLVPRTNDILHEDLTSDRYVTLFFGMLDASSGLLEYVSAGQAPLLYYNCETNQGRELCATTYALGMFGFCDGTPADPVHLQPGDIFILVSDGFLEWADETGEQFGSQRIFDVVNTHPESTSAELISHLYAAALAFAGTSPQSDDLTAVIIKRSET